MFKAGKVTSVVTQNVDRLHHKAGSDNVIELHGTGYIVKCLKCPYEIERSELQEILMQTNPNMKSSFDMIRPDGDVELSKVIFVVLIINVTFRQLWPICTMSDCKHVVVGLNPTPDVVHLEQCFLNVNIKQA